MNEAAFLGETIRGAILSVPQVQKEAGYSIGMTKSQTFIHIILPQAIKVLVPAYGTTLVGMIQSTSMLYTIGVVDIMQRSRSIGSATGHLFEGYAVCAVIYIISSLLIKLVFNIIERRMSYGRG
jgi:L-cystine transport system permease protein